MCGIVGYVGPQPALEVVVDGLKRLEYRGYDSAGVAVLADGRMDTEKRAGKLANLKAALSEAPRSADGIGIGHTRWATHGAPTDVNAHPHVDNDNRVAVIHNGIIENFASLRLELEERGCKFSSETDTEVAAHLLGEEVKEQGDDLAAAMRAVCRRLEGAFTLVAMHAGDPDLVVAARRNSPLVVGRGDGENFLASDVAAFIAHTRDAVELGQDQVVELRRDSVAVTDYDGNPAPVREYHVDWDASAAEKGGYDYFMLKEIVEQPQAVADTLLGRVAVDGTLTLDEMRLAPSELREIEKIVIIACGTSYHAGLIAKYAIEHWCRVPCEVEVASEFRYRDPILNRQTMVIAISQSGESMDTLMAVRYAREQRARVLAICNVNGSTIPRESDGVLYTHAGPEVGVAATKTFLTQLVACYLIGLYLAQVRNTKFGDEINAVIEQLANMPEQVERVLGTVGPVRDLARSLADSGTVLFLGRHVGYPVALEGALKLKELAYMHAEAFAAGELKHGPIALIEDGLPVVVVVPSREGRGVLHDKIVSNIQEIRARGARTIVIAEEGDESVRPFADELIEIPAVPTLLQPIVSSIPMQVFACELALAKGNDVDQPRNLAKSVTVE
ncbi:glutamine--fructose-6-phosphate transaminase (isomerizing) [Streptomonospora wellingtoniae]|uniref:Glutamine--fructose-6-phosphate aminotransferase [isomerizing] n=1 Tax=Streptomonospora wellingtoniae TaxID=3075544 RepID=A0ABU2KV93_9ACTN|nr:glutamine--fructose-6-phosphate transaminase (isomerizing) [Streptomonospora sp. DSM 45055]MDT0303212.1 glutamine--fructose-6-phosphate transaminase (isomerizing) [Streptomonospora sp. DSM 45055]